jgi:hypothetical protein
MLCFKSPQDLALWLFVDPVGRKTMAQWITRYCPVLAVEHEDRVEVYSEHLLDFRIFCAVADVSIEDQEADIEKRAGERFSRLFWPGRASHLGPGLVATLVQRRLDLSTMSFYTYLRERFDGPASQSPDGGGRDPETAASAILAETAG